MREKKFLLWKCYIRPHFLYLFYCISNINKTTRAQLKVLWKGSAKEVLRLPKKTPDDIVYKLTDDPEVWMKYFEELTFYMWNNRFGESEYVKPTKPETISTNNLKTLPENFGEIFRYTRMVIGWTRESLQKI